MQIAERKMRILVFVENFMSPTLTFVYNEIIELAKHHDVKVLCTKRCNKQQFPFDNIVVVPFSQNRVAKKLSWDLEQSDVLLTRKNRSFKKNVSQLIREFKPDIIHCHFGYESIVFLDNMGEVQIPVFISFHGYDASQMLAKKCYVKKLNYFFKRKNIIPIYVSKYIKTNLEKSGVNMSNGELLYYGVRNEFFDPEPRLNTDKKPFVFLQISSFNEKKGHIYTLQAFEKFLNSVANKNDYKLILAGDFGLIEQMKYRARALNIAEHVEFTGYVNRSQCKELLLNADVFLHHSVTAQNKDTEGLPNAILEAMAMELPVISTWHAGIPEMLEDGVNGYLVEERDVDTYTQRMRDILNWGYQTKNREKILNKFSLALHYNSLKDIYSKSMNSELRVLHLFAKYPNNVTSNWLYNLIVNTPDCKTVIAAEYYTKHNFYNNDFIYIDNPLASITYYKENTVGWSSRFYDKAICLIVELLLGGFSRFINRYLESFPVDIVHAHFADVGCKYVDGMKKKKLPMVVSFYGYDYEYLPYIKPAYVKQYKNLFLKADKLICEGTHGASILLEMGCAKEKIEVVKLGVDTDSIRSERKNKNANTLNLVQVAALREKKGHIYTLMAFHKALSDCPEMHLTLVGGGDVSIYNNLITYMSKYGLSEKVTLQHEIDFEKLHKSLSEFDVFIHPSCYSANMDCEGGAPIVLLDAQACGLPIISTTHCDIPDEVVHLKTGLLTPEKDVDSLTESIKIFYRMQPKEFGEYSEAARKHVEENYSIKKNAIHLRDLYNSLTSNHKNN